MSECPRFGKWIGGCRFEPRYDLGAPTIKSAAAAYWAHEIAHIAEASKPRTYVKDVCVRCGKEVLRAALSIPTN